ncbi:MAG: hypothetical protein V4640_15120 [Verrucomicrobiota bacterium]
MSSEKPQPAPGKRLPVFVISCWAMALMAFAQLLVAGMALATRFEESQVVKTVIKEVPKIVAVRVPAKTEAVPAAEGSGIAFRPPPPMPANAAEYLPPPTPVTTPKIADPVTERLVMEARQARVAGDMGRAIVKLEDALNHSADDPNVHYELGLVHEQMGVFDVAGAHFEKVFQMKSAAGSLFEMAAEKIGQGFTRPDYRGKLSLGRAIEFKNPDVTDGEHVTLTIPVQKAPGEELDLNEVSFMAHIFNRTSQGEVVELEDKSWLDASKQKWVDGNLDFANGEEKLRMIYEIPSRDVATQHLFGELSYYGHVILLLYKGEVVDVQAWPRELAARIQQAPAGPQLPEFPDMLPNEYDPNMLLPPLPEN